MYMSIVEQYILAIVFVLRYYRYIFSVERAFINCEEKVGYKGDRYKQVLLDFITLSLYIVYNYHNRVWHNFNETMRQF